MGCKLASAMRLAVLEFDDVSTRTIQLVFRASPSTYNGIFLEDILKINNTNKLYRKMLNFALVLISYPVVRSRCGNFFKSDPHLY